MVTLAFLNATIRQRADQVNSDFITDDELNGWINSSVKELYDLLVEQYADEYFMAPAYSFVTTGASQYALPADFYKLKGIDVAYTGDSWITLSPFVFQQRNRYSLPSISGSFLWQRNIRYRIVGNNVMLIPTPPAGQTFRVWYVPRSPELLGSSPVQLLTSLANGQSFTMNGEVFGASAVFGTPMVVRAGGIANAVLPVGTQIDFGTRSFFNITPETFFPAPFWAPTTPYIVGNIVYNAGTPNNVLYCSFAGTSGATPPSIRTELGGAGFLEGSVVWRVIGIGDGFNASIGFTAYSQANTSGQPTTLYLPGVSDFAGANFVNSAAAQTYIPSIFVGNPFWRIPDSPSFPPELTPSAASLARAIVARSSDITSQLFGVTASASGDTVAIGGRDLTLSALSPSFSAPALIWNFSFDGFGGWEEYVVADCLIKCANKDEADPQPAMVLKEALKERIQAAASNRDSAGPEFVADVESTDWGWRRDW